MSENVDSIVDLTESIRESLVGETDEQIIVRRVAEQLQRALDSSQLVLPQPFLQPLADRYAMYPLHVAANPDFSIAVAVWGVGQWTPIHDHETWGVVGVVSGVEHERRYELDEHGVPVQIGEDKFSPGDVTVCCTSEHDIHAVGCHGTSNVVALHVYGSDIGTKLRHTYERSSGERRDFVSSWCAEPRR